MDNPLFYIDIRYLTISGLLTSFAGKFYFLQFYIKCLSIYTSHFFFLSEQNATLTEIVDSFPEQAVLFGVVPEKDLINRFKHVKAACKRVAAVQDGDSILKYVVSYVKSVFVVSRWYLTDVGEAVDVEKLTCYEILAKAEHFIQEGDLETAAKLMSQLTGVARKLSGDWLNEVRLLLETKQTVMLLQAYTASLAAGLE